MLTLKRTFTWSQKCHERGPKLAKIGFAGDIPMQVLLSDHVTVQITGNTTLENWFVWMHNTAFSRDSQTFPINIVKGVAPSAIANRERLSPVHLQGTPFPWRSERPSPLKSERPFPFASGRPVSTRSSDPVLILIHRKWYNTHDVSTGASEQTSRVLSGLT